MPKHTVPDSLDRIEQYMRVALVQFESGEPDMQLVRAMCKRAKEAAMRGTHAHRLITRANYRPAELSMDQVKAGPLHPLMQSLLSQFTRSTGVQA